MKIAKKIRKQIKSAVNAVAWKLSDKKLKWSDDNEFKVGGIEFVSTISDYDVISTHNRFVILKTRAMINRELELVNRRKIRNILDIGIWEGGSVALLDRAMRPDKIVAVEYKKIQEDAPIRKYISKFKRSNSVKIYDHINQADSLRVNALLSKEFPSRNIDLVIDDASHFYEETRSSFNAIFPYLSAGGYFIIEDWGWSHDGSWTVDYFKEKLSQTNLIVELLAITKARPDLIDKIEILHHMAIITKGVGNLEPGKFDIGDFALNKGRQITPVL